jgi:YhcH/YjgK/YiaL family protein
MIIDTLANASYYSKLGNKIKSALNFLQANNISKLSIGRHDIDGDTIFALVQTYETKPQCEGKWEAHRKYIDVQYVAQGQEKIGYANLDGLTITQEYSEENDVLFLEGKGDLLSVPSGTFAIFTPQDAHMPCLNFETKSPVKKVVIKILA